MITLLTRPAFDGAAIVAWYERELPPKRCARCRRAFHGQGTMCSKHEATGAAQPHIAVDLRAP